MFHKCFVGVYVLGDMSDEFQSLMGMLLRKTQKYRGYPNEILKATVGATWEYTRRVFDFFKTLDETLPDHL